MKEIKYIVDLLVILTMAIIMGGCNGVLNLTPQTQISDANFWNTTDDLEKAANYLYTFLPGMGDLNDNDGTFSFSFNGANSISDGSRIAPATDDSWNNDYELIRASNNILEKAKKVSGDTSEIVQYLGEAHFFRAWAYFDLVHKFGGVPLITKTLGINDKGLYAPRADRDQVYALIYQDLDFAAANLPLPSEQPLSEYGRITSTASLAFKSRVALFEGTREKFHNYGNPQKDLQLAVDAGQKVMRSGEYKLFVYAPDPDSSYRELFLAAGDGPSNKESILVKLYAEDESNNLASESITNDLHLGHSCPTRALADMYLYKDGLPLDKSPFYKEQTNSLTQFENRDPRMGMTIFNKNLLYTMAGGYYQPNFNYTPTGYKFCKYFVPRHQPDYDWVDFIIIRYAEVLLNYAEAKFELNNGISDADLNMSINLIRKRLGMPNLTNEFVQEHGLDMRTEIRRERSVELANEGFQYWDLIRWKTAETVLPKAILGAKYFKDEYGETNVRVNAEGYVIVQKADGRHFNSKRDYLWPIPLQELGLNPALTQNPNW